MSSQYCKVGVTHDSVCFGFQIQLDVYIYWTVCGNGRLHASCMKVDMHGTTSQSQRDDTLEIGLAVHTSYLQNFYCEGSMISFFPNTHFFVRYNKIGYFCLSNIFNSLSGGIFFNFP